MLEKPLCMRCDHELELVHEETADNFFCYICPVCLTLHWVSLPDEDLRNYYHFYNEEVDNEVANENHGYNGLCPNCGHHIIWGADFMRSEVMGDVDNEEDDSLASDVHCPNCGTAVTIIEAKPSELEKKNKNKILLK